MVEEVDVLDVAVDVVLVVVLLVVVEVVVVVVVTEAVYVKVAVWNTTVPNAPHVAFTVYVPLVQLPVPPATVLWEKAPVLGSTASEPKSTGEAYGLRIDTNTAVFGPGAGTTFPVISIAFAPV